MTEKIFLHIWALCRLPLLLKRIESLFNTSHDAIEAVAGDAVNLVRAIEKLSDITMRQQEQLHGLGVIVKEHIDLLHDAITVQVLVKCLRDTPMPRRQTENAIGFDLTAAMPQNIFLFPRSRELIPTGIQLQIPKGYEGQIRPRSGWASSTGVTVLNSPGTIDSDYRGEVFVNLINNGKTTVSISPGDRIAQLVIAPVANCELSKVDELTETERGEGGHGSTGVN